MWLSNARNPLRSTVSCSSSGRASASSVRRRSLSVTRTRCSASPRRRHTAKVPIGSSRRAGTLRGHASSPCSWIYAGSRARGTVAVIMIRAVQARGSETHGRFSPVLRAAGAQHRMRDARRARVGAQGGIKVHLNCRQMICYQQTCATRLTAGRMRPATERSDVRNVA